VSFIFLSTDHCSLAMLLGHNVSCYRLSNRIGIIS
jgi:hypothetical protein